MEESRWLFHFLYGISFLIEIPWFHTFHTGFHRIYGIRILELIFCESILFFEYEKNRS